MPWTAGDGAFVGVVHLLPLPGNPRPGPGLSDVRRRAIADASALVRGGATGLIVENLGDAPFAPGPVDAATVAMMTSIAEAVRRTAPDTLLGVNVLRNDPLAAMAVAAACGAQFIRVNVHVGAMATDQGIIEGRARDTLQLRRRLDTDVRIAADVDVKHAAPLAPRPLAQTAQDIAHRAMADALIVTGSGTGKAIEIAHLDAVRDAVPDEVLWAGSGVTPANIATIAERVDGIIVGTWLHEDGDIRRPIDAKRTADLADMWRAARR